MSARPKASGDPVLVVGSGPVGLTLASELLASGVEVRLIERRAAPSPLSRALVVWPRTLQVLRRLGGSEAIEADGRALRSFRYYSSLRPVATIRFGAITQPVVMPQPDVERLLATTLAAAGGTVDRCVSLIDLQQNDTGVDVTLATAGGLEHCRCSYVVGCDGADSTVRTVLGLDYHGFDYPVTYLLVDAFVDGLAEHDIAYYYCSPAGILVVIGLPNGRCRVFTGAPPGSEPPVEEIPALMQRLVDERGPGGLQLHGIDWASAFTVQARHSEKVKVGRVFLAGDAAHIHSPAGGQGMNTGITDADNLAWKLALAWHGRAGDELLDTYATERREVTRSVLRQADFQTRAWLVRGTAKVRARDAALRLASAGRLLDATFAPWLAGIRTRYRRGALAMPSGPMARVRTVRGFAAGRLVPPQKVRLGGRQEQLSDVLSGARFSLLGLWTGSEAMVDAATRVADLPDLVECATLGLDGTLTYGMLPERDALVLVRPDLHVAVVSEEAAPVRDFLSTYLVAGARREAVLAEPG